MSSMQYAAGGSGRWTIATGRLTALLVVATHVAAAAAPAAAAPDSQDAPDPVLLCGLSAGDWVDLDQPSDAQSILTRDASEIDLGIRAAAMDDAAALARLVQLAAGRSARLLAPPPGATERRRPRDRYGRRVAPVVLSGTTGTEPSIWLQATLVADGLAIVAPPVVDGSDLCLRPLLELEEVARRARRGHWAGNRFRVLQASDATAIAEAAGRLAIVEGRIYRVSISRDRVYLNFGRNWRRDFTVRLDLRTLGNVRSEAKGGATADAATDRPATTASTSALPDTLRKGRRVRVRGYVELRGGPLIEIDDADLIEPLPDDRHRK